MNLADGTRWTIFKSAKTNRLMLELHSPFGTITLAAWNGDAKGTIEEILHIYDGLKVQGPIEQEDDPDASQLTHEEEQDANQQIYERLQATTSDGFDDARRRLEALAPAPPYKEDYQ